MPELLGAAVMDLLLVSALGLLGSRVARVLGPDLTGTETLAASFPLGAGAVTSLLMLISWLGVPLRWVAVLGSWVSLFALVTALRAYQGRPSVPPSDTVVGVSPTPRVARLLLLLTLCAIGLVTAVLAIGRAYSVWDAPAIWAAKGYGIALRGTVFAAREWGAHGIAYPLNIPLLISLFRVVSGDLLPGSMLVFPLFLLSTLVGIVAFWRRMHVPDAWMLPGVSLVATAPAIFHYATYGYANIPFSAYLVQGSLLGVIGVIRGSHSHSRLAGLLLAMAVWTRPEGILYTVAVLAPLLGTRIFLRHSRPLVAGLVVPVVAYTAAWFAFFSVHGVSGSQAGNAMSRAFVGWMGLEFRWLDLRLILGYFRRSLLDVRTWGALFPVAFVMIGLGMRRLFDRSAREYVLLGLVTVTTSLVSLAIFYVGSYGVDDMLAWLTSSFPRAYFPSAFLLATLAFSVIPPRWPTGRASSDRSG